MSRCGETVSRTIWPDREGRGSQGRKRPPEKRCWSSDPKEGRASRGVVQAEGPRWPHRFTSVAVAIQKRTGSCPADVTRASGHSVRARAGRSGEGHTVLTRTRHRSRGSRAETCDASLVQPRTEVRLAPRPLVPLGSPCGRRHRSLSRGPPQRRPECVGAGVQPPLLQESGSAADPL